MKHLLILSVVLALAASSVGLSIAADPKAGDAAPSFALVGTDGKTYSSDELKGKKAIVIAWFPKAKTKGCTLECKSMKEFGDALKAYDVAYFTASCDTPELNKEFATDLSLDYPILSDPTKKVAEAYGVVHEGRPNPERWTFYIGKDGKILAVDKTVKTETHGKDIAAKLGELGVAKK